MAVLRSGKNTIRKRNKSQHCIKQRNKIVLREFSIKLINLTPSEIQKHLSSSLYKSPLLNTKKSSARAYNLRQKKNNTNNTIKPITPIKPNLENRVAILNKSNVIWRELTSKRTNELQRMDIVLAKMGNFRPWPTQFTKLATM